MTDRISRRRGGLNQFFIGLQTGLLAILVFTVDDDLGLEMKSVLMFIGIIGTIFSFIWMAAIRAYRNINKAKFSVLIKLEEELPFSFYRNENEVIDQEKYSMFSTIEILVPFVMAVVFLVMLMIGLFNF